MSDNKIIANKIVTYDISYRKGLEIPLGKCFTKVASRYSKITKECSYLKQQGKSTPKDGIYDYYTIDQLADYVNYILKKMPKHEHAFLKGIFKRGTSQINIAGTNDYLPIDIDDKDNKWLKDASKTSHVLDSLKRHTVFIGHSASGSGIWGMVLVKGLGDLCQKGFNETDKTEHKKIAKKVYRKLEELVLEDTDISISLDDAQGAFRHIRYAAYQKTPIIINYEPTIFSYEKKEIVQKIPQTNGVIKLKREREIYSGTIYDDFNNKNNIWDLCESVGLSRVGKSNRLLRIGGKGSTGEVKENGAYFICNSSTYASSHGCIPLLGYTYYYPHHFYMITKGLQCYRDLEQELIRQGYKPSEIDLQDMYDRARTITSNEAIFKFCEELLHRDLATRWDFYIKAPIPQDLMPIYRGYLNIKPLKVEFDEELLLEGYVSTRLSQIFDLADAKGLVALNSPTGSGKTESIIRDLQYIRPGKRALIVESLTATTQQAGKDIDTNIVRLYGSHLKYDDFDTAKESAIVIATYNQAIKFLSDKLNPVDYIVIDELHSLVLGNAYREKILKEFSRKIEDYIKKFPETKIIGMTGTSIALFKDLGFYMVNLYRDSTPVINVIQRKDGRSADIIIKQHHINNVTKDEKVLYRAVTTTMLPEIKEWFIKEMGYKEQEVVYFTGEEQVKHGINFIELIEKKRLAECVKVVLSSPVIDEGVSINNEDFTQVVYIDNQTNWRPEPFKQLTARFRQPEELQIYIYIKARKEEVYVNETASYEKVEGEILDYIDEDGTDDTTYRILGSLNRYKHEDGSIYKTGIAYKTSEDFFKSLTTEERNLFLKLNYNMEVIPDLEYEKQNIKPVKNSISRKERDTLKAKYLYENWDEMLSVFYEQAKNPDDKQAVMMLGESLLPFVDDEQIRSFVWRNYNFFLTVIRSYTVFLNVSDDPFKLLFKQDGLVESMTNIERKADFFKVMYTLKNLGHKRGDRRLASKYLKLLKECDSYKGYLTIKKVLAIARKARIPNIENTLSSKNKLKDIISANTSKVWDKDNHFVNKKENPAAVKRYMRDWLKPFNQSKEKHYKYKSQITKQLKLEL